MPPIVCVVGHHNSGKTTLIERLIVELRARGYRIATAKHAREIELDRPGTDSWRQIAAGSQAAMLVTTDRTVIIRPVAEGANLDEVGRLLGEDHDLVLAEGFKQEDAPKIEAHRKETGPLLTDLKRLVAVVSDEPVETKARHFGWADIKDLADLLEEGFIKPQRERLSVYVNGTPVVLSSFPREFVENVVLAMAASLKGVGEVKTLEIRLRKGPTM
jgi:molybdopterin-guanine dinucleotide biosynthesis protein B